MTRDEALWGAIVIAGLVAYLTMIWRMDSESRLPPGPEAQNHQAGEASNVDEQHPRG